jgi:hypothetical protein
VGEVYTAPSLVPSKVCEFPPEFSRVRAGNPNRSVELSAVE